MHTVSGIRTSALLLVTLALCCAAAAFHPATPARGATVWHVLVDNVPPEGFSWSFNAFYPDRLQVHPGDTIVFTLARNPNAFHTMTFLGAGLTPEAMYDGFTGGFIQPNPQRPGELQSTYFRSPPASPCGRAGQDPCVISDGGAILGTTLGVLVNPPPSIPGATGNTSVTVQLAADLAPGPYYVTSLVDGPAMAMRLDVTPQGQPVQSAAAAAATAQREYEADVLRITGQDWTAGPPYAFNLDGTRTWQVKAGDNAGPAMAIDQFVPPWLAVIAGDTVTWTSHAPGPIPHTVSGFGSAIGGAIPQQNPYQPACIGDSGDQLPPPDSFPPDIWNTCPGEEANNLTSFSRPSAPSGAPYDGGARTSGILLNQEYLESAIGDGLPFGGSYSIMFPNTGTYAYACAIHPGMTGLIVVQPKPQPH